MEEGRPDLALDAGLVEARQRRLQRLAGVVHVVRGGGDRARAVEAPGPRPSGSPIAANWARASSPISRPTAKSVSQ